MSNLVSSQVILTSPSKVEGLFIPKSQVAQIAKGLQQNEFLKTRLTSAEKALNKADEIIKAQKKDSELNKKMIDEQNKLISWAFTKLERLKSAIQKAESTIALLQERRTALISAAVTGKIDLRNWKVN